MGGGGEAKVDNIGRGGGSHTGRAQTEKKTVWTSLIERGCPKNNIRIHFQLLSLCKRLGRVRCAILRIWLSCISLVCVTGRVRRTECVIE